MSVVYLGLGSNLGDRVANLEAAVLLLNQPPESSIRRVSSIYETEPVGVVDQPWFLNAVAELETALEPPALLRWVKELEREIGRQPARRWGRRVIDIDILLYDAREARSETLTIPHRELWNRPFVLVPLAELRSDLVAPSGESIGERIDSLRGLPGNRVLPHSEWPTP